jgi:DNA adenine methylase
MHHPVPLSVDIIARNDDAYRMRYPGGKGKAFQHVINLLPPHRTYVESHLGGGAVLLHKKPSATSIGVDRDPEVIKFWRKHFPRLATYIDGDAIEFLSSYPFGGDDVLYCDPPYLPSTRRRRKVYQYDYKDDDHKRLLKLILQLPCRVVLSGYLSEIYLNILAKWNTYSFTAKAHDGLRVETLWFNYAPPDRLHDHRFLGKNFRERETIRRRLARLQRRISILSRQEQHIISDWLADDLRES